MKTARNTMLSMVTFPYAINFLYWFLFYRRYPKDVAKEQARLRGEKVD